MKLLKENPGVFWRSWVHIYYYCYSFSYWMVILYSLRAFVFNFNYIWFRICLSRGEKKGERSGGEEIWMVALINWVINMFGILWGFGVGKICVCVCVYIYVIYIYIDTSLLIKFIYLFIFLNIRFAYDYDVIWHLECVWSGGEWKKGER